MISSTKYYILFILTVRSLVYCDIYRLPKVVKPIRYDLTMEPHLKETDNILDTISYEGRVVIDLETLEDTKIIIFHQVQLEINSNSIKIANSIGKNMKINRIFSDDEEETCTIFLENELMKGENYKLTIGNFSGYLGSGEGFFEGFYWMNEKSRSLAATHFEPTGARRAFPCFDEPSFKAKFIVNLIRKPNYNSVSNENLEKTEDLGDGKFKDTFKETPLMSTFTLAFAVTDYKFSEKLERHRILARPEAIDKGEWKFSLEIAHRTLIALEEYTGIDFVIDKMDQIAIPDDYFYEHAMENWGLIVYGESHLLRDNNSQAEDYKRSACYIAHEFAHQWFGNLVTPVWWDYLWLSEAFASYFQFYIADIVQPSWRLKEQFLIDMVHAGLEKEEKQGAHPLNYQIQYSGQYPPFHIMYEKASSIIRMAEHFLTPKIFRKGIQIYLNKNKFKNVVPKDLYAAFQQAVNQEGANKLLNNMRVAEIFGTWDSNKGYPIITVTRDYETGSITLEQKSRFEHDDNNTNTTWIIPINYIFSTTPKLDFTKTTADYWLKQQKITIKFKFPTDGWLMVNKQQTGHYRVNYDLENWNRIIKFLINGNFTQINLLNRAQLINDAFNLARNKKIPWNIPLNLGEYIIRENDYIPLASFYNALSTYLEISHSIDEEIDQPKAFKYFGDYVLENNIFVDNQTEYDVYKDYIKRVLSGVKDRLGFEEKFDDTHLDKLHRSKFMKFIEFFSL